MPTLTTDQLEYLRSKVGSTEPTTEVLQEKYDRLLDLDAVARIVLETRLADLLADPASFSIPGEYSQDTRGNIEHIQGVLASLGGESPLGSGSLDFMEPCYPDYR